jgi:3-oxoacyl-[acyl-carrier protein] reductase
MSEQKRVAIVTGATRGIGLAIATRLARDGYDIVANYRGDDEVAEAARLELETSGRTIVLTKGDISQADDAGALIETALSELGQLDVLVNNAGITRDTLMMRMSEDDWDAVLNTNLKGAFLTSKAAIRPMIRQRSGRIVNLTSVVGLVGNAGQANYASAKAGLVGLTKSMAKEVGSRGITVNAVAPGFIETRLTDVLNADLKETLLEQIPAGRLGQPDDVATY